MDALTIQNHVRSLQGIGPIQGPGEIASPFPKASSAASLEGPSFGDILKDSIAEVNRVQIDADKAIENLATGKSANIHGTLLQMQQAELSMRMLMEVRNKVITAYQEIMRLQV